VSVDLVVRMLFSANTKVATLYRELHQVPVCGCFHLSAITIPYHLSDPLQLTPAAVWDLFSKEKVAALYRQEVKVPTVASVS